jgi:hypothetical protein
MRRTLAILAPAALSCGLVGLPCAAPAQGGTAPQAPPATCNITSTTRPWYPPGTMDVQIDGQDIGNFQFGPGGNTGLNWQAPLCTPGPHSFQFTANFSTGVSTSCSGSFTVGSNTNVFAQMNIGPNGTTCSL